MRSESYKLIPEWAEPSGIAVVIPDGLQKYSRGLLKAEFGYYTEKLIAELPLNHKSGKLLIKNADADSIEVKGVSDHNSIQADIAADTDIRIRDRAPLTAEAADGSKVFIKAKDENS